MSAQPIPRSFMDQFIAGAVDQASLIRMTLKVQDLDQQDVAFAKAMEQMASLRKAIGDPAKILGSIKSKHGEVAEFFEVYVRNARSLIKDNRIIASFENVGRTSPIDFMLDGTPMQAKWYGGLNTGLSAIREHFNTYPGYTAGKAPGRYVLPRDQFDLIKRMLAGEDVGEFGAKKIASILSKIRKLETDSGFSFEQLFVRGETDYSEVQAGVMVQTLDDRIDELKDANAQQIEAIDTRYKPSVAGAAKTAASAAAIAGAIRLAMEFHRCHKEGRNVFRGELTREDWQIVLGQVGLVAGEAGITAGALYVLTNFCDMHAPLAAAMLTAVKGVGGLLIDLHAGDITLQQFSDMGLVVCAEAGIANLAAAAGQFVIPIPLLGAVIGTLAGQVLVSIVKNASDRFAEEVEAYLAFMIRSLDGEAQEETAQINALFDSLGELTVEAFSTETNERLYATSIALARTHRIDEALIIHNEGELDDFMLA